MWICMMIINTTGYKYQKYKKEQNILIKYPKNGDLNL